MKRKALLFIAIGCGGMIGATTRYSISIIFESVAMFPFATLVANMIGCFSLSFLLHHEKIKQKMAPEILAALTVGVISSFTTFSTFAMETTELWNTDAMLAILYVFISIVGGLGLCYVGYVLATKRRVPL